MRLSELLRTVAQIKEVNLSVRVQRNNSSLGNHLVSGTAVYHFATTKHTSFGAVDIYSVQIW